MEVQRLCSEKRDVEYRKNSAIIEPIKIKDQDDPAYTIFKCSFRSLEVRTFF